jgi:hypothetical protein
MKSHALKLWQIAQYANEPLKVLCSGLPDPCSQFALGKPAVNQNGVMLHGLPKTSLAADQVEGQCLLLHVT